MTEDARRLAHETLIADTHIDLPYRLSKKMEDVSRRTAGGDFDYVRAREGGLDLAFMSIFVPASYQKSGGAKQLADELIDMVEGLAGDHPDKFRITSSVELARNAGAGGVISLALGMENGAPVEGDLANLAHFFRRGVRYITLTHSENNQICDSSYADDRKWNGLSDFGHEVVAEMNRLGIMIDVSHVSDDAFRQVLELTRAPVVATHSSCRHFTPGFERNMSDEMIRDLAANGGVIQINFGSSFLDGGYRTRRAAEREAVRAWSASSGSDRDSAAGREFIARYREEHPNPVTDVKKVADHIDHVVGLVGVDHVGLGSDFDGVGDSLPDGLKDVSEYPNLLGVLIDRGYTEDAIRKVASGNLLRAWSEVERVAAESRSR